MTLQTRLRELLADHDHESAVTLAKAALKNEKVVDVVVEPTTVTVETRRFRGVHRWRTEPDGNFAVEAEGTYICTCDGVDLSFTLMHVLPAAQDRVMDRLRERTTPDSPAGAEAVPDPTAAPDPGDARAASGPEPVAAASTRGNGAADRGPAATPSLDGRPATPALRDRPATDGTGASTGRSDGGPGPTVGATPEGAADPDFPTAVADGGTRSADGRSRTEWLSRVVRRITTRLP